MKVLIIIGALLVQYSVAVDSHEGEQVWRVSVQNEGIQDIDALAVEFNLDVWSMQKDHVDVAIVPQLQPVIKQRLHEMRHPHTVMIENIQALLDEQEKVREQRQPVEPSAVIDISVYHELDEIYAYIDELEQEFDYISVEIVGQSLEGRDIKLVKISTQANNTNAFWVQCGIHAREWVSPATCLYGLDYLTQNYGVYDNVTAFVDAHDIYMVVVVNPDGYTFSWSEDRLWRKNRRINEDSSCIGVDLHRNFDIGFGRQGSSDIPCMATYHGEFGFSEPETSLLKDKIELIMQTQFIDTYFDIHAYGQWWLIPYGYSLEDPENYEGQLTAGRAAATAIQALNGTVYEYGSISDILYVASGGSIDWTSAVLHIPYNYSPELRDTGDDGFLLPEELIAITAEECWIGLFAAFDSANQ